MFKCTLKTAEMETRQNKTKYTDTDMQSRWAGLCAMRIQETGLQATIGTDSQDRG